MVEPDDVQAKVKAEPFYRFTLITDEGDRYDVAAPDCAYVTATNVYVLREPAPGKTVPRGPARVVDLSDIRRIEVSTRRAAS